MAVRVSGSAPNPGVQDEGSDLPVRRKINFTGTGVSAADDAANDRVTVSIAAGSGGHVIKDEGVSKTGRTNLDFVGPQVSVSDDSGADTTRVTIVSEVVNVLDYGAVNDGTGDQSGAINDACDAARTAVGTLTQGVVFFPRGSYRCTTVTDGTHIIDAEGLILKGEGMEASRLTFPTDSDHGVRAVTFQKTETATRAKSGPRDMYFVGPSTNNGFGELAAEMDGVRLGNAGYAENCNISGFRSGLNLFKDHENARSLRLGGNTYGILFDRTESGGDQFFEDISTSGHLVAGVAVHPDSNVGGAYFVKCHLNFGPVSILKLDVGPDSIGSDYASAYTVHATGNTTNGSNVITNVSAVYGEYSASDPDPYGTGFNPTQRVVGSGIPAGATITGINLDGANTLRLSANATATATGIDFYSARFQTELISSVEFHQCSFESWGNALVQGSKNDSVACLNVVFRDCLSSNSGGASRRAAGWSTDAAVYRTGPNGWQFDRGAQPLACTTNRAVSVFSSAGTDNDFGEMGSVIDGCNSAGIRFANVTSGSTAGSRGIYNSTCDWRLIQVPVSSLAKGEVLQVLDLRAERADGSKPVYGVALTPTYGSTDRIPVAVRGGPVSVKVHASNAGTIAANKYVKVDTSNAGCCKLATGPTDGEMIGFTTSADSGGFVTTILRGLR